LSKKIRQSEDNKANFFNDDRSTIPPKQAVQAIQSNSINNNQANITVNVADGRVKSVESSGDFKTDVFLNNGVQN